jgi:inhibitor of cysteine peptidase
MKRQVESFVDPAQVIHIAVGQAFAVELPANPTTGYLWQPQVDRQRLEWTGEEYRPGSDAIGAGGREIHRFRALEAGRTEIVLEYRRPWDTEARDVRRFRIKIT